MKESRKKMKGNLPSPASPKALPIKSAARASPSAAITFACRVCSAFL
jgi:hypothetical protein